MEQSPGILPTDKLFELVEEVHTAAVEQNENPLEPSAVIRLIKAKAKLINSVESMLGLEHSKHYVVNGEEV